MTSTLFIIHVGSSLTPNWAEWFDGMEIALRSDGTTTITGPVRDQAELFGLLIRVRDLGLPLLAVYPVQEFETERTHRDASGPAGREVGGAPGTDTGE